MFERIQHLSAAMAAGDSRAVDAFYRQYFDWMYAQARRVTRRDESFCLDVVQDAVLRVMRAVKPVDCENRFRGWLRLVVQTTAFDLLRSEARRKNREAMSGKSQLDVGTDSLQLDWLREQIGQLDPELVNLIELRFEQSWSLRKIGEKTGLTIGAVDGRLRRAMKNLKLAAEDPSMPVVELESPQMARTEAPENESEVDTSPFSDGPEGRVSCEDPTKKTALRAVAKPEFSEPGIISEPDPALVLEPAEECASGATATQDLTPPVIEAETFELVGLEDEAGAYDDAL